MPEDFANLHVLGVTSDGRALHTIRSPTAWTPFGQIPGLPDPTLDPAVDVACVRRVPVPPETTPNTQGLWAFIAFENSPPRLLFRDSDTTGWSTIPANILPLPIATRVAVTVSPGVAPPNDPTDPGGPRAYVHLTVVSKATPVDQGRLISAIMQNRGAGGISSAIAEVQTSGAGDLGPAAAVALAPAFSPFGGMESIASLGAVFTDGAMFFTGGGVSPSGGASSWGPFRARDLAPPGGPGARPGMVLDIALVDSSRADPMITDTNGYMGIVRGGGDADIYGTTLGAAGWSAWDNFEIFRFLNIAIIDTEPAVFSRLDMSKATEGLHVVGVGQGQIFHQLRPLSYPGTAIFRDVELAGMGTDVGNFIAVACG